MLTGRLTHQGELAVCCEKCKEKKTNAEETLFFVLFLYCSLQSLTCHLIFFTVLLIFLSSLSISSPLLSSTSLHWQGVSLSRREASLSYLYSFTTTCFSRAVLSLTPYFTPQRQLGLNVASFPVTDVSIGFAPGSWRHGRKDFCCCTSTSINAPKPI